MFLNNFFSHSSRKLLVLLMVFSLLATSLFLAGSGGAQSGKSLAAAFFLVLSLATLKNSHVLSFLLILELMFLLLGALLVSTSAMSGSFLVFIIIITLSVCEAVTGFALVVKIVRATGSEAAIAD